MRKMLPLMLVAALASCATHSKQADIDSYTAKKN